MAQQPLQAPAGAVIPEPVHAVPLQQVSVVPQQGTQVSMTIVPQQGTQVSMVPQPVELVVSPTVPAVPQQGTQLSMVPQPVELVSVVSPTVPVVPQPGQHIPPTSQQVQQVFQVAQQHLTQVPAPADVHVQQAPHPDQVVVSVYQPAVAVQPLSELPHLPPHPAACHIAARQCPSPVAFYQYPRRTSGTKPVRPIPLHGTQPIRPIPQHVYEVVPDRNLGSFSPQDQVGGMVS
ncbi:PREDICTED: histone-lysine N-methyltransferase 2D-like isoform X2 [Branchiostoma belcheri]|uniref:Histone-lysine N-methyltransferase 2D-like isoform X2 n=1 Tax=Branchiostoma belcheri TaxID=7741 RepID=A0A6P4ZWM9_BRABE|nr:PREDICTED: histone-lysine N-methyltransferase 2D-like isoform X2 [Branchiostoma belcheri]